MIRRRVAVSADPRAVLDRSLSEAKWQRTVTDYATLRGWRWYHDQDARRNRAGLPDLILVRRGRLVFAELKRERGKPSKAQLEWLGDLGVCVCEVYVWRPSDWPEVERTLK